MNTFCISQISPHFAVFVPLFLCFVDFLSLFPIFCVEFRAVNFLNFFPCICRFCRILLQIMQVCLQFFNFLLTFPASVKLQTDSRRFGAFWGPIKVFLAAHLEDRTRESKGLEPFGRFKGSGGKRNPPAAFLWDRKPVSFVRTKEMGLHTLAHKQ